MPLNAVHFGAKRKVKWGKTQCKMVQNAVQNGAKRSAKWCKTQGKKHKHPPQMYKQSL